MQTPGAGRDLDEAEAPAVVPLPAAAAAASGSGDTGASGSSTSGGTSSGTSSGRRLLVWAIGHSSSGVPAAWAAARGRPGVFAADLSPAGVRHLADLVRHHKRPGDIALVSGERGRAGRSLAGITGWQVRCMWGCDGMLPAGQATLPCQLPPAAQTQPSTLPAAQPSPLGE